MKGRCSMSNKQKTNYRAWLTKAEHDLLNIENNIQAARIPWDTVCFHAQQVAEKVLKGFLVYHRRKPEKTHNLVALLERCVAIDPTLNDLGEDCRDLTFFAVKTRYPGDVHTSKEEGEAMIDAAYRVRSRVLDLLHEAE